jgi:glycosyltransferase 2 family protein
LRLSRALRIVVAVALTAYILFKSDPAAVVSAAAVARVPWLVLAVVLVVVDRAVNAYRWVVLLQALTPGSRPPLASVMHIFFVSSFVGNFLPSIGGDVYRAYQLARLDVRSGEAAASVLMDRMVGVLSMVMVAAVALLFLRELDLPGVVPALLLVAAVCAAALAAVFSARVANGAVGMLRLVRIPRVQSTARTLVDAVRRYASHHGALLLVLLLSVAVQLLRVVQAYCLGRALDLSLPMIVYFGFVPVITLVMQLPITVAGLGTTQYAFEWMFGRVGVSPAVTFALSMLFLALGTVGNLPGGLLYAFGPSSPGRRSADP